MATAAAAAAAGTNHAYPTPKHHLSSADFATPMKDEVSRGEAICPAPR